MYMYRYRYKHAETYTIQRAGEQPGSALGLLELKSCDGPEMTLQGAHEARLRDVPDADAVVCAGASSEMRGCGREREREKDVDMEERGAEAEGVAPSPPV
jgi:hypothetical protein